MTLSFPTIRAAALLAAMGLFAACEDEGNGPTPLPAPTGLTVSQLSLTSVRIQWGAVTGAQSYVLQRASAANPGVFTSIGGALTVTTYDDAGLTTSVAYSYRVAAAAASDTSSFSGVSTFTTGVVTTTVTGPITANRTFVADTVYVLQGYVKVQSGATLTIQPGTKIVGDTGTFGSSLWILRGAKIVANGTALNPIVFTSQRAPGNRKPGDWGGIVIVGNGIINRTGTVNTEGPGTVAENYGGGADNTDSSGVLRYVRIEFAGFDVSGGGNSELNNLSMYAVGSKTVLENVQTLAGLDDSFEWWGGAVDGRYLVSYESGDDHFDWSEGWVGRVQYAIGFQQSRLTPTPGSGLLSTDPQGIEADGCSGSGCTNGFRSLPYPDPVIANLTLIGSGTVETQASGGFGAVLRRGTKGLIANSIIARWKGTGITVRDSVTGNILTADSLNVHDVVFAENTQGDYDPAGPNFGQAAVFASDGHRTAATAAAIITSLNAAGLNWTPTGVAASGCGTIALPAARTANFFGGTLSTTTHCGAVDPAGALWYSGWTVYAVN